MEYKELLVETLRLRRERGDDLQIADTLRFLSDTRLGDYKEGILRAKEALEIYERLNDSSRQGLSLRQLASLLYFDEQFDAAKEAALRPTDLLSDKGEQSVVSQGKQFPICEFYRVLGQIYHSKGETEKATKHFETAIGIASTFNWHDHLVWNNYSLAELFFSEDRFDDAHARIERAKSHAVNDSYNWGRAMELQAGFWYEECKFEEAEF